jgi:alcohol dehydrogenase (cytochrome c)
VENVKDTFAIGTDVHFCPGSVGGDEWSTPGYDPTTNLIISGTVDWCDTVTIQTDAKLRSIAIGQPWTGMAALNPVNMFGKFSKTDGHWAGWVYASDADTGVWKWRAKSNYPIVAGITPTAGGVVFFGDVGGNFYALDAASGQKLFTQTLGGDGGAIGGGIITYTVGGVQKVAVAQGMTMPAWPVKPANAKIIILGLDSDSTHQ